MPDRVTPVRSTEVRGLLRQWWRFSRGSMLPNLEDLRKEEARIWGSTDHVSPIKIEILGSKLGIETPSVKREGTKSVYEEPRYALFPAQSRDAVSRDYRPIYKGGSFDLRFCCPPDFMNDLDAALRYWTNFGGIGARARRGLGALFCKDTSGRYYDPADFAHNFPVREWPQLKGAYLVVGNHARPMSHTDAWKTAVNLLYEFRQQRNGHMGRSRWPEPDAIRRLTGDSAPAHATPVTRNDEFPRGKFGAPIIFHFRQDGHRAGDPDDTTLLPVSRGKVFDRMASPLIVKPLAISPTHSLPMCLLLNSPQPDSFVLQTKRRDEPVVAGPRDVLLEFAQLAHSRWGGQLSQL